MHIRFSSAIYALVFLFLAYFEHWAWYTGFLLRTKLMERDRTFARLSVFSVMYLSNSSQVFEIIIHFFAFFLNHKIFFKKKKKKNRTCIVNFFCNIEKYPADFQLFPDVHFEDSFHTQGQCKLEATPQASGILYNVYVFFYLVRITHL